MRILLIGSGGREHALAWKLAQSPICDRLYAAPGNPGIAGVADLLAIDLKNHAVVAAFCQINAIDLVVIGPEQPLVDGLADTLAAAGVGVFGPSAAAARLEGSKGFTKDLCAAVGIPTARYRRFTDAASAKAYARSERLPIVVKADGLAAGKGVVVAATMEEAEAAIDACFGGGFGDAGNAILIEECLEGREASLFALSDGTTVTPFGTAEDYKRVEDGDRGPNTGGMGAISPAPGLTPALVEEAMATVIRPTVAEMARRGAPFRGVLYAGLMLTADGPKLIEYNVRFGDPECQVLMRRLTSDLAETLAAVAQGRLAEAATSWSGETAVTVVMAARGYPGPHQTGSTIRGVGAANAIEGVTVFHAGTRLVGDALVANGGRVLSVTATGSDAEEARRRAYKAVAMIDWPEGHFRRDIGAFVGA